MFGTSWLLLMLSTVAVDTENMEQQVTVAFNDALTVTMEQQETIKTDNTGQQVTAPIIITNAIEQTMLEYKHWTGKYTPDIFTLSINNTPVAPGETYSLESIETPLTVQFDYSFKNGYRKGSKTVAYTMNKDACGATLTFSWDNPCKVIVDNATVVEEEIVS